MNHKHLLALFLFFIIIASSAIVNMNKDIMMVKDVSSNVEKYHIENFSEEDDTKKINIFYPVTEYENVNQTINNKIDYYKNKFVNSTAVNDKKILEISFEEFEYKDYISFKFNVKTNLGISHDTEEIFTIIYKQDKIIDISYLKQKENKILDILYDECYMRLKDNSTIKQFSNEEWLKKGLEKTEDNYQDFIFTNEAMVVFFNEYTVAPYVAGIIHVEIPYDKLINVLD